MTQKSVAYETLIDAIEKSRGKKRVHIDVDVDIDTAHKMADLMRAELAGGAAVFKQTEDLTTTQAAMLLGLSRPTLIKLLEQGALAHHTAGTHRRIKASDLQAFMDADRQRKRQGIREINALLDANDDEQAATG